ncbi:7874_t:CDS:2 [Paraglomus occultum]|uniref:7874_t:CDS:1 n=1 Tax=Paraglomus occultum TaxID=144539 RepID=A0A9N8ZJL3_9GLOM|nr:7874_t:CDS:2 [Paraglomus occultum]
MMRFKSILTEFDIQATGVALTAVFFDIYSADKVDNIFGHVRNLLIVLAFLSLIITILAGYGLSVLFFQKSPDRIRIYTYLSWFYMVFVWSAVSAGALIAIITKRNSFINYCANNITTEDKCKQSATRSILRLAIGISITTICNIYFTTILQVCHNRLCQNYPDLIRKRSQKQASRSTTKTKKETVVSSLWTGRHFWEKKLLESIDSNSIARFDNGDTSRLTDGDTSRLTDGDTSRLTDGDMSRMTDGDMPKMTDGDTSRMTDEDTNNNDIISGADIPEASDTFDTYKMTRIKSDQETRENNEYTEDEANCHTQQDTDSTIVQDPDPYVYHSLFRYKYKK